MSERTNVAVLGTGFMGAAMARNVLSAGMEVHVWNRTKEIEAMNEMIDGLPPEALRAGLRRVAYAPGEEGYEEARTAWNLNAHQGPALVVVAESARTLSPRCAWLAWLPEEAGLLLWGEARRRRERLPEQRDAA